MTSPSSPPPGPAGSSTSAARFFDRSFSNHVRPRGVRQRWAAVAPDSRGPLPRRRARDVRPARRPGRGQHPLTAPSPRAASPGPPASIPSAPPTTPWATASSPTPNVTAPSLTPSNASQKTTTFPWRRSPWPGCSTTPTSPRRSSEPPNPTTSTTRPTPSTLTSRPLEHTALTEHDAVRAAGGFQPQGGACRRRACRVPRPRVGTVDWSG